MIGQFNREHISRFKRTQTFTPTDYDLLRKVLSAFVSIRTTPHILAEVSNLAGQLAEPMRAGFFGHFRDRLELFEEIYIESKVVSRLPDFIRVGLTDSCPG